MEGVGYIYLKKNMAWELVSVLLEEKEDFMLFQNTRVQIYR